MAYRPPTTTSKYAPADPMPGRKYAPAYRPKTNLVQEPKEKKKELTPADFPALNPVAKSASSISLASNASNTSNTSKPLTLAERMRKKIEEEEAERQRKEEEERMKKEHEMNRERDSHLMFGNIISFSQLSQRIAEERFKEYGYADTMQSDHYEDRYDQGYSNEYEYEPEYDVEENGHNEEYDDEAI